MPSTTPDWLSGLAVILGSYAAGALLERTLDLPLPAAIVGLLILLGLCLMSDALRHAVAPAAHVFVALLGLLILPAGVGMLLQFEQYQAFLFALFLVIVPATALTMLLIGPLMQRLLRAYVPEDADHGA